MVAVFLMIVKCTEACTIWYLNTASTAYPICIGLISFPLSVFINLGILDFPCNETCMDPSNYGNCLFKLEMIGHGAFRTTVKQGTCSAILSVEFMV